MRNKKWLRLLAYVTGSVNQELLLQNEYLAAENRILRAKLPSRLRLSNPERATLAEIGKRLGCRALQEVARVAKPDTILAWYRRLIARKFDGSKYRPYPGRPRIRPELKALVVRMARENSGWGYDRIVGALANLGHRVSDQTVGNILRRYGLAPAPKRSQTTSWRDFISALLRSHGCPGRSRLLHRGSAHLAWTGYLLRTVFSPSGKPSRQRGRHDQASGFKRSTARSHCCLCNRVRWSEAPMTTNATEPLHCLLRWS
jgi:homeodomain-containing protein